MALLAGGLAKRMHPITRTMPKAMIEVAGEPFIAHQLRLLARNGITQVVICCGHLGEQIIDFIGDGAAFGCHVSYSHDGPSLLGTGGALRKALPLLGERFLVMYGDSWLDTDFRAFTHAFLHSGRLAMMSVFHNASRWDASNVEFVDNAIRRYDKVARTSTMRHIDWGLGGLTTAAFDAFSTATAFDLAEVYQALIAEGQLAGYEIFERFYEIGSPRGLAETDHLLRSIKGIETP